MTQQRRPPREEQALREVGRTEVGAVGRWLLVLGVLAPLAAVVVVDALPGRGEAPAVGGAPVRAARSLVGGIGEARERWAEAGALAANRALLAGLERTESALEDVSRVRGRVQPATQWALTALAGVGNEQVYLGRDGWLFYRPDVDLVTGPGFLEPAVLARRSRGGDAWEAPPQPDPVAAILDFRDQLAARGIALLVVPTPVKPAIHPERFAGGGAPDPPLRNPSERELRRRLEAAGVPLLDLAQSLGEAALSGEPHYLATDTHWRPEAVDRAARELARAAEALLGTAEPVGEPGRRSDEGPAPALVRRPVVVEGRGDLAALLGLPEGSALLAAERAEASLVTTRTGRAWRPQPGAPVLLLGDSFTNVYSDPGLGWGAGAGLAEQLAFHLGRPVDRLARNAGGPAAARRELARAGPERLAGTRLVVWQFAARELASGDWERVRLPPP